MIDPDGVEWQPVAEAARRAGVTRATIRSWVHRRKVAGHRIHGRLWVRMPDVYTAEHKTRGAFTTQRGDQVQH